MNKTSKRDSFGKNISCRVCHHHHFAHGVGICMDGCDCNERFGDRGKWSIEYGI